MAAAQQFTLVGAAAAEALRQLNAELESRLAAAGVARAQIDDARLIAEELLANVIDHGLPAAAIDDPAQQLAVRVTVEPERLQLQFRYPGSAYDPREHPLPDLDADIADRPIGGLGLFLVRELADSLDYCCDDGYNVFSCALRRPCSTGGSDVA